MASTDANLTLTRVDVHELFEMIGRDWQLFEATLIDRQIWDGRVRELKQIRHRIAHCRRSHHDNLARSNRLSATWRTRSSDAMSTVRDSKT
jgi:hypothetical protein